MVKTAKKGEKKSRKTNQNVRIEAKTKNLDFLLVPEEKKKHGTEAHNRNSVKQRDGNQPTEKSVLITRDSLARTEENKKVPAPPDIRKPVIRLLWYNQANERQDLKVQTKNTHEKNNGGHEMSDYTSRPKGPIQRNPERGAQSAREHKTKDGDYEAPLYGLEHIMDSPSTCWVSVPKRNLDKPSKSTAVPQQQHNRKVPAANSTLHRTNSSVPLAKQHVVEAHLPTDGRLEDVRADILNDWLSETGDTNEDFLADMQDLDENVNIDYEPPYDEEGRSTSVSDSTDDLNLSTVRKSSTLKRTYARAMHPASPSRAGTSSPTPAAENNAHSVCVCGQQPKIDQLKQQNDKLVTENKKLKCSNEKMTNRCLTLTDALNAKVLGKPHDENFTEVDGYPYKIKLKKFSEVAGSRDYIFVKLLLLDIFPDGLKNKTLTGRVTNNPNGRKGGERVHVDESTEKDRLEPAKVKYIEERFVEHRCYQGDTAAVAGVKIRQCRELIA